MAQALGHSTIAAAFGQDGHADQLMKQAEKKMLQHISN
jgi:hypothetical protein